MRTPPLHRCLRQVAGAAILLWIPDSAPAQKLTFGVVAGMSATGDFETGSYAFPGGMIPDGQTTSTLWMVLPVSRGFIIGPKLELKLLWGVALEADALHRALHSNQRMTEYFSGGSQIDFGPFARTHASWEFPVLAKYRIARGPLFPFFEGGPSMRPAGSGTYVSHRGATAGAGIELRARGFNVSPSIRFTRWRGSAGSGAVPVAIRNQLEFLAGFDRGSGAEGWAAGFGKRFSPGVLVGVGLGDDLETAGTPAVAGGQRPDSNSPIIGLILEFAIYRDLFLEADGSYRPLHAASISTGEGEVRFAVLTWEFPVMAKYKFRTSRRWHPFAELGPAFRLDGNFSGPMPSHYGAAGGAGIEVMLGRLKLSPTIRYIRWAKERSPQGGGTFRNEAQAIVGFAF